jgi:hypothetical protein
MTTQYMEMIEYIYAISSDRPVKEEST